jgi:predicted Zn-dependent protease
MRMEDQKTLERAIGYLELGMADEAEKELEEISPEQAQRPEIVALRLDLAMKMAKWKQARQFAQHLTELQPNEPQWIISLAFAVRRMENVRSAREILSQARSRFPAEALIPYNLACYACQLNEIDVARELLRQAFLLDGKLRKTAFDDEDLLQLRAELDLL